MGFCNAKTPCTQDFVMPKWRFFKSRYFNEAHGFGWLKKEIRLDHVKYASEIGCAGPIAYLIEVELNTLR